MIFFLIKASLKQHFLTKRRKENHIANGTYQDVLRKELQRQRINEVSDETNIKYPCIVIFLDKQKLIQIIC